MNTLPNHNNVNSRYFSPYEQTQLARHDLLFVDLDQYGEMPVEYITKSVPFYGEDFHLTTDVLIPRVETETLVNLAMSKLLQLPSFQMNGLLTIADVGTGSGAIGITISNQLNTYDTNHTLLYTDISQAALDVASMNAERLLTHKTSNKVNSLFIHSDLFSDIPNDLTFDLIVANLPYVPSKRIDTLHTSVKDYEPHLALDGGVDGLELIHALLQQTKNRLKTPGYILLEIDHTHSLDSFADFGTNYRFEVLKDDNGLNRYACACLV